MSKTLSLALSLAIATTGCRIISVTWIDSRALIGMSMQEAIRLFGAPHEKQTVIDKAGKYDEVTYKTYNHRQSEVSTIKLWFVDDRLIKKRISRTASNEDH